MLFTVYKTEFAFWKIFLVIFLHLHACLLPSLLFSLKHMTCHVLTHKMSDWNKHLSHNVYPVSQILVTLVKLKKSRKFDKQLSSVYQDLLQRKRTRSRWRLKHLRGENPPINELRISEGHVIKGSCDIIGRGPSREAIILPSFLR